MYYTEETISASLALLDLTSLLPGLAVRGLISRTDTFLSAISPTLAFVMLAQPFDERPG